MKRWVSFLLLLMLLMLAGCNSNGAEPEADAVRLHVIANSDSQTDQDLKYKVRDALLSNMDASWTDARMCFDDLSAHIAQMEATADAVIKDEGFDYEARVETGVFDFPTRVYDEQVWPAGQYLAVRVILGTGAGHNWWCVIYPKLCMNELPGGDDVDAVTGAAPDADDEESVVLTDSRSGDTVRIRSWLWERLMSDKVKKNLPRWLRWEYTLDE